MITVVNKHTHTPTESDYYIGRGSALGNPFTSIQNRKTKAVAVCESLEECLSRYEEWLDHKIREKDQAVCAALNAIWVKAGQGEVNLVCFCKPKQCHGDSNHWYEPQGKPWTQYKEPPQGAGN